MINLRRDCGATLTDIGARELCQLCRCELRPRLHRAKRRALMLRTGVSTLRTDVHATLQQPLLEHRVHVHERLDRDSFDPLGNELPKACRVAEKGITSESDERRQAKITAFAHVTEDLRDRRMRQRALFTEQSQQRLLEQTSKLCAHLRIIDPVRNKIEVRFEALVSDDADQRLPLAAIGLQHVADAAAMRM